jgi:hypothetical protein
LRCFSHNLSPIFFVAEYYGLRNPIFWVTEDLASGWLLDRNLDYKTKVAQYVLVIPKSVNLLFFSFQLEGSNVGILSCFLQKKHIFILYINYFNDRFLSVTRGNKIYPAIDLFIWIQKVKFITGSLTSLSITQEISTVFILQPSAVLFFLLQIRTGS